jgi:hypothetical protein
MRRELGLASVTALVGVGIVALGVPVYIVAFRQRKITEGEGTS